MHFGYLLIVQIQNKALKLKLLPKRQALLLFFSRNLIVENIYIQSHNVETIDSIKNYLHISKFICDKN